MRKDGDLVDLFFADKNLVRQHIESFNYFIEKEIKEIVQANDIIDSDIDRNFYLRYLNIRVEKPTMIENMVEQIIYPQECRIRDITYAGNIYVDIEYIKNKEVIIKKNISMGKMPIMIRSSKCHLTTHMLNSKIIMNERQKNLINYKTQECIYDNGGYFIIKGVEKVIHIQEQQSKNRIIIEMGKNGLYTSMTSSSIKHKNKTNVIYKNDKFYIQNTIFIEDVPIVLVLKTLGLNTDEEIVSYIGKEGVELMELSFGEVYEKDIYTETDALIELSKFIKLKSDDNKEIKVKSILAEKLFPNIKIDDDLKNKGICLCLMIRKLILAKQNLLKPDDKDYLGNKRFELAGQLLSILFEDTFKKFNFELKKSIDKILSKRIRTNEFDALTFFNLQTGSITTTLSRAISSGNWNLKRFKMERSGVTHVLTRYSYITALGMMTKINSHFEKTRKVSGPRSLHPSSWGMFCPADTPEGESCGLVKNLALLTEISTESDSDIIKNILQTLGVIKLKFCQESEFYAKNKFMVFINGELFGLTSNIEYLCCAIRKIRREGKINKFVSIFHNKLENAIYISTDNGRICRPLIIIKKNSNFFTNYQFQCNKIKYKSFNDLLLEGLIEYVDVNEENDCLIALHKSNINNLNIENYTHLEIADYSILSLIAGLIPFPHHNQSPRNTYQCAMGKQAIGHIGTNIKKRFDLLMLQLNYTQRPLSCSKILDINKYNKIPAGINAMVAVMSYSGYDIEDAIIVNKDSIERGFMRVEVYKTIKIEFERFTNGKTEEIYIVNGKEQIIEVGTHVMDGDILITKVSPIDKKLKTVKYKGHPGYIDTIILSKGDDDKILKIKVRETRCVEIGDKFSSRHGQKGVVGLIVPQVDLPFNEYGVCPDIIMNPHGFPSRMTVGKILELIGSKVTCLTGEYTDATPFENNTADNDLKTIFNTTNQEPLHKEHRQTELLCQILIDHGYSYSGKDVFTSGITGEQFEAYIFFGPIFYQRLKHMVADKIHCRSRGPRAVLTRQPTEGRSKDGGLRLGEMERDCLIGYGANSLLNERLMHCSDEFNAFICETCGIICYKERCYWCSKKPIIVKMPYACKLLFQEMMAMNILPKIILEKE